MNRAATKTRNVRTFSSARYLEELMAELDRAAISVRLAESREQAGLTQNEMADLLGIHFRSVQNYESPKETRIPWDQLDQWASIARVTKEWLLHGDSAATPQAEVAPSWLVERVAGLEERLDRALEILVALQEAAQEE